MSAPETYIGEAASKPGPVEAVSESVEVVSKPGPVEAVSKPGPVESVSQPGPVEAAYQSGPLEAVASSRAWPGPVEADHQSDIGEAVAQSGPEEDSSRVVTYTEGEHVKNTLETHGEGDILAYCGGNIPAYIGGNHGIQEEDTERYQVTEGYEVPGERGVPVHLAAHNNNNTPWRPRLFLKAG